MMLMNIHTGSVVTYEEWRQDYNAMTEEERLTLWGGPEFEDANLIPVKRDAGGDWVEV